MSGSSPYQNFPTGIGLFEANENGQRSGTYGVGFQAQIERNRQPTSGFSFAVPNNLPSAPILFGSNTVSGATQQQPMAPNFSFGNPTSMTATTSTQNNLFGGQTNAPTSRRRPYIALPSNTTQPFGPLRCTQLHNTPPLLGQFHNPNNGNAPCNTPSLFGSPGFNYAGMVPPSYFAPSVSGSPVNISSNSTPGPSSLFNFDNTTRTPLAFGLPPTIPFDSSANQNPTPSGFRFISGSDSSTPAKFNRSSASPLSFIFDAAKVNTEVPSTPLPQPIASSESTVTEPLQSHPQPTITTLAYVAAVLEANQLKMLAEIELVRIQVKGLADKQEQERERGKDTEMQQVYQRITDLEARCGEFAVLLAGRSLPGGGDADGKDATQTSHPESDHDE